MGNTYTNHFEHNLETPMSLSENIDKENLDPQIELNEKALR